MALAVMRTLGGRPDSSNQSHRDVERTSRQGAEIRSHGLLLSYKAAPLIYPQEMKTSNV